jgi:hypothetical protein
MASTAVFSAVPIAVIRSETKSTSASTTSARSRRRASHRAGEGRDHRSARRSATSRPSASRGPCTRPATCRIADHGFGRRAFTLPTGRRPRLWGEHACVVLHPGDRRVIGDHELARLLELLPSRDEPCAEGCVPPLTPPAPRLRERVVDDIEVGLMVAHGTTGSSRKPKMVCSGSPTPRQGCTRQRTLTSACCFSEQSWYSSTSTPLVAGAHDLLAEREPADLLCARVGQALPVGISCSRHRVGTPEIAGYAAP